MASKHIKSQDSIKVTVVPSTKNPGGKIKGSVDGQKVSPPKRKR